MSTYKGTLNELKLIGNLAADPEVKTTTSGTKVVNITVVTNSGYKDQQGQYIETPEFHKVTVFGKLAEIVEKYCVKGKKVYVDAKLKTEKWEDKEGQTRYTTKIIAENLMMLSPANKEEKVKSTDDEVSLEDLPF